jgi:ribose-phosphate pyrophosphokinase
VLHMVGDVVGRVVLVVDDMFDTAGTLVEATTALLRAGARRVYAGATHAVLSGPAMKRLEASDLEQLVVTDTIPLGTKAQAWDRIKVLSVAPLLGEAIRRIHCDDSVSSLFN